MNAKNWLEEHGWDECDFSNKNNLDSMAVSMEMFANTRILEALKRYNIDPIYCFCETPVPVLNNKSKCATEICERKII